MITKVIYHKSDFDGIFCREIAAKFIPDADLIGWEYGEPTPEVASTDQLYILDLSIPNLMAHPNLIWIDHHKTAIEKYPSNIKGYRIDGVAACRLTWQWFQQVERNSTGMIQLLPDKLEYVNRSVVEPWAVRLAGEYDIWDKRDSTVDTFQHGLRSRVICWERLLELSRFADDYVQLLIEGGRAVEYSKLIENCDIIKKNGFTIQWEGLCFLCCNAGSYNSLLFTQGIQPEHDALLGFSYRANHKWSISLYGVPGKPEIDLSKIAVKYGGGGHKQACGFTCKSLPFLV